MTMYLKVLVMTSIIMILVISSDAYAMRADNSMDQDPNYDYLARYIMTTRKRSCIRRGGSCDHRPSDCCDNSTCRCNLWGTNCRCQRLGLFQKWGK